MEIKLHFIHCANLIKTITYSILLLEKGTEVNGKIEFCERTPLSCLCQYYYKTDNMIDNARLLIQHGADVNTRKLTGMKTFLYLLCENYLNKNNLNLVMDLVQFFVHNGEDINVKMRLGSTPLDVLCQKGFDVY